MSDDELKAIHDKHFDAGLAKAKATPDFAQIAPDRQALRITNEVCDLVKRDIGTYGKDRDQREVMNDYVMGKAMAVLS